MRMKFFGDSYDIVKQGLLRWLNNVGDWAIHPMFTEKVSSKELEDFEIFLGVRIISKDILSKDTNRNNYFNCARISSSHLFLDPDTGIKSKHIGGKKAPSYLFTSEFIDIAENRPNLLTLSFDQSLARGKERKQLEEKVGELERHGLHGFAYESHACFVLVGKDIDLVKKAIDGVRSDSRLPRTRLICFGAA
jgi:hypothetical protein